MQIEKSPFLSLDKSTVIGFLKSTGSRDTDILYTQKRNLESAAKFPKLTGIYLMVLGGLLTITIIGAFLGLPLLGVGWWMRRRGVRNLQAVEDGYLEYAGTAV